MLRGDYYAMPEMEKQGTASFRGDALQQWNTRVRNHVDDQPAHTRCFYFPLPLQNAHPMLNPGGSILHSPLEQAHVRSR
jgi:hypothetical protein